MSEPIEAPPPTDRLLVFFKWDHLPIRLQDASRPFCILAMSVVASYPSTPERTVCLRKLLEAKDCAVRILVEQEALALVRR